MSKVKIQGDPNGTGALTIAAPNTNTDRTLTLPDSSGTIATAESTLSQFNASGSAPVYACRAWVNFNGTDTVAIRASGNVSSITDNGVGDYTVNFTNALPDTNYACAGVIQRRASSFTGGFGIEADPATTTTCRINTVAGGALFDNNIVQVAIFR